MATETKTETLGCGCEWQIDFPELIARCATTCAEHPRDRGRPGLLPKPLPLDFTFSAWIAVNVRRERVRGASDAAPRLPETR